MPIEKYYIDINSKNLVNFCSKSNIDKEQTKNINNIIDNNVIFFFSAFGGYWNVWSNMKIKIQSM